MPLDAPAAGTQTSVAARAATTTRKRLDTRRLAIRRLRVEQPPQPLFELDLRLPAEDLLRARDVGSSNLGVVDRQRLVDDLARGPRDADHRLREIAHGALTGVAEVHGQAFPARREQEDAADQVVDVAEAPRLRAVAEHRQRLVRERLPDEG